MLGWKQFLFFDKQEVVQPVFTSLLSSIELTAVTSARGLMFLGDAMGQIHVINRHFDALCSFQAYDRTISHLHCAGGSNIGTSTTVSVVNNRVMSGKNVLVTVGMDDADPHPVLKLWNLDKILDFQLAQSQLSQTPTQVAQPTLMRSIRIQAQGDEVHAVTALVVSKDLTVTALGLNSGLVVLIRGDLSRDRFTKQKVLHEDGRDRGAITGLGLKEDTLEGGRTLFVVTAYHVRGYGLHQARDTVEFTDDQGCEFGCVSVNHSHNLIVTRDEAVYIYAQDGRGPCFVLDGRKEATFHFRSYLAIVGTGSNKGLQANLPTFTIYDLRNKLIAFSSALSGSVQFMAYEWGTLLAFTSDRKVFRLTEKDVASKLDVLFKKNLYPLALNLARNQNYDEYILVDILKRYADYLYSKGDYENAMFQYIQTIGKLEPSYVIRRFLDAQRVTNLTQYLQALHEQGHATANHTTLLLNCYTKLHDVKKLEDFIKTDKQIYFDVETAIEVCRSAEFYDHALYLAQKYEDHDAFIRIQMEDLNSPRDAATYIQELEFEDTKKYLLKYGSVLMTHIPEEMTQILIKLCTSSGVEPANAGDEAEKKEEEKVGRPEDFIQIFVSQKQWLLKFLETMIEMYPTKSSPAVWNTIIELYLAEMTEPTSPTSKKNPLLELLKNPQASYDADQALIMCQVHKHRPATLYLLERLRMYKELVQYHMDHNEHKNVITACKKFGDRDPSIWVQVLTYFANKSEDCRNEISEVLKVIDQQNLLPPLRVVEILSRNQTTTLEMVKDYIVNGIKKESQSIDEDTKLIESYQTETSKIRQDIEDLRKMPQVFQVAQCSGCATPLDLPSVHFLCKHSFHLRCLGDNEKECLLCAPDHRLLVEIKKSQETNALNHDLFFKQLESADDGFGVIAEYFGRNTFLRAGNPLLKNGM